MEDRSRTIDWNDLRVFLAVFRTGSLRGAARALGVNHATVTRRLAALEHGLGARLFDRRRSGFALSQAGEDLLPAAERVERECAGVERALSGRDDDPSGLVRVTMPYAVMRGLLAPEIAAFGDRHPGIDLEIELTDRFTDLANLEADVSIRMTHEVTGDVVARRLIRYGKTLYATPALAAAANRGTGSAPWLGWDSGPDAAAWIRDTPFPDRPVRHVFRTHLAQVEAACAGLGLTMLPCFLGDAVPGLCRLPGAPVIMDRSIWLLVHGDLRRTARVRAFLDFVGPAVLRHRTRIRGTTPLVPEPELA